MVFIRKETLTQLDNYLNDAAEIESYIKTSATQLTPNAELFTLVLNRQTKLNFIRTGKYINIFIILRLTKIFTIGYHRVFYRIFYPS